MQSNFGLRHVILTIGLVLAPAPAFAIDEALLPRNLSPWGMFPRCRHHREDGDGRARHRLAGDVDGVAR
ncbi:hypothetical protein ACVWXN_010441 [Bradyrhizobium sp. i1.4.4]